MFQTSHYKRYNNPLLLQLEDHCTEVGSISIPHVTVVDELAVFARRSSDMQVMVWDIENNTGRERYCVNPTKSSCLCYNLPKRDGQGIELVMSGGKITCEECTVHLGITRDIKNKVNIGEKLILGRKTAYSLMGAGSHSVNELKTCLNGHIWASFVVSTVIYGLETLSLTKKDIENFEKFQRKSLRQIQGLPNCVTLALFGRLPLETVIYKNSLDLLMGTARNRNVIEYDITKRQLAMKAPDEKAGLILLGLFCRFTSCLLFLSCLIDKCQNQNGREA